MREDRSLGLPHTHLAQVVSTNDVLRELAENDAPEGACVTADLQTAGRGRFGRRWTSDTACNLLLSVLLRPRIEPGSVGVLSLLSALAVAETIEDVAFLRATVKWPNDVLIRGRKCCGILLESSWSEGTDAPPEYVIVGIGLNVNQDRFDSEFSGQATSLLLETGQPIERQAVLDALMDRLSERYRSLVAADADAVRSEYLKRLEGLGREVDLRHAHAGPVFSGVIETVTPSGGLVVRLRDGSLKTFVAGEVTTRNAAAHDATYHDTDDLRD